MRFYTGDENGIIKAISLPRPRKRTKVNGAQLPVIDVWGKIDKREGIQLMQLSSVNNNDVIVAARNSGRITMHSSETESVVKEYTPYKTSSKVKFVGLNCDNQNVISCIDSGECVINYHEKDSSETIALPSDLCRMRIHPKQHSIFAFGGKERDIEVHDLNLYSGNQTDIDTQNAPPTSSHPHAQTKNKLKGQIFAGKNVKNDFLDLRPPIHITDLQFLEPKGGWEKIVTGTQYHQVRIYDAKSGRRRPVHDWKVGQDPILTVNVGGERDPYSVYVTNTTALLASIDIRTGKIIRHYRGGIAQSKGVTNEVENEEKVGNKRALNEAGGPVGAVLSTAILGGNKDDPDTDCILMGTVGLDRYLRIYNAATPISQLNDVDTAIGKVGSADGKLLHRIYLKSRLNAVCSKWDPQDYEEENNDNDAEVDEDEEIWKNMEDVSDEESIRPSKKRIKK